MWKDVAVPRNENIDENDTKRCEKAERNLNETMQKTRETDLVSLGDEKQWQNWRRQTGAT